MCGCTRGIGVLQELLVCAGLGREAEGGGVAEAVQARRSSTGRLAKVQVVGGHGCLVVDQPGIHGEAALVARPGELW